MRAIAILLREKENEKPEIPKFVESETAKGTYMDYTDEDWNEILNPIPEESPVGEHQSNGVIEEASVELRVCALRVTGISGFEK